MNNARIAEMLERMAILNEYAGGDIFKTRAYQNAAETLYHLDREVADIFEKEGGLESLSFIGRSIRGTISEFLLYGGSESYNALKAAAPSDIFNMLKISGIGVKKLKALCAGLKIEKMDELFRCASEGLVSTLKGFSKKTEDTIISEIERIKSTRNSKLLYIAQDVYRNVETTLRSAIPGIKCRCVGEIARKLPVIKKISIAVNLPRHISPTDGINEIAGALGAPQTCGAAVESLSYSALTLKAAETAVEIFATAADEEKFAGLAQVLSLDAHYLCERCGAGDALAGEKMTEEALAEIIKLRDLAPSEKPLKIAPEYSECAWRETACSELLEKPLFGLDELKGTFHVHSDFSDGIDSLEAIARTAMTKGLSYIGIADHSKSSFYANGLDEGRLARQIEEIDALNKKLAPFKIFKGIECDILKDGSLDFDDRTLGMLDYVIISVHSLFKMPAEEMTARICRAILNPNVTMLGHPTGRLLNERKGYDVDMLKIFEAARDRGVMIELNCNPHRMDVDYRYFQTLKKMGVRISVNPDAHIASDILPGLEFGVNAVNLGGLSASEIFNAQPAGAIDNFFKAKRGSIGL